MYKITHVRPACPVTVKINPLLTYLRSVAMDNQWLYGGGGGGIVERWRGKEGNIKFLVGGNGVRMITKICQNLYSKISITLLILNLWIYLSKP